MNVTTILQQLEKNKWQPLALKMPGDITIRLIPQFYPNTTEKNADTLSHVIVQGTCQPVAGPLADVVEILKIQPNTQSTLTQQKKNFL